MHGSAAGNVIELMNDSTDKDFKKALDQVQGLKKLVEEAKIEKAELYTFMELALHGLAEFQVVNKEILETSFSFGDLLSGMLDDFGVN